jgi:HEAT repeat protein
LWATAGGPSIEIQQIDYTEVLREKQGLSATIDKILAAAMAGPRLDLDDSSMEALVEIVSDPAKLEKLLVQLAERGGQSAQGVEVQTSALLNVLRGLADHVSRTAPDRLGDVFAHLGEGVRHMSAEAMSALLAARSSPDAMAGTVNVVTSMVERAPDAAVAGFVATQVAAEHGATERLAHAFQNLVPDFSRQRQVLALARDEAAASELGSDESFPELWHQVEGMLTSYTDARYVSDDYARELSHARTQPVGVEQTGDDPPERIAAWLGTVNDAALRNLDRDLLTDLLSIEMDPLRWRDVADTVVLHADDLVRVGYFDQAWHLIETVISQAGAQAWRQPHATAALERFGQGSLLKHVSAHLRGADDRSFERLSRLCHAIGPPIIVPLAEVLAAERDARSRRRLRDILVGFGPKGAESVRPLMNAANWEVRRTAAYLLREFGGAEGLKELVPLLNDAEPLVQREAVQGLVMNGTDEASAILLRTLTAASGRTKETLTKEILGMREDRASGFFAYVVRHMEPARLPSLYVAAIEALGTAGGPAAIGALETALNRGQWWTPFANRRFRSAAAQSLRRIGTPEALEALREASSKGSFGVRAAARAELGRGE